MEAESCFKNRKGTETLPHALAPTIVAHEREQS
jgi:hypothetical protein